MGKSGSGWWTDLVTWYSAKVFSTTTLVSLVQQQAAKHLPQASVGMGQNVEPWGIIMYLCTYVTYVTYVHAYNIYI